MKTRVRSFLRWIRRAVFHNLGWKAASLAIAVMLWALVASEPVLATFATARVEYINLPEDLEISSQPVSTVALELRGPAGELERESLRPAAVVDMSGARPGERTFSIGPGQVDLPRGVRLIRAIPSEVRFRFERRVVRSVNVVPQFAGEGQNGYRVANWRVNPPQVTIVGPAGNVERIRLVSTDPVDVSNVVGSTEIRVNAFINDSFVRFQTSPQVSVAVTMKKY